MDETKSSAQRFLEEHDLLKSETAKLRGDNLSLTTQNTSLLSEVNMLREELERTDQARIKIQGFASQLMARLTVISETIAGAVVAANAFRVVPEEPPEATQLEVEEARKIVDGLVKANGKTKLRTKLPDNDLVTVGSG